jgi:ElaB/YqjD/DUF883 family membrane-anchored ribosome-binding protein
MAARRTDQGTADQVSEAIGDIAGAASSMAGETMAGAGEAIREGGRTARRRAGRMAEEAYAAGTGAARSVEREMLEHPWTVALAAAAVAGVLGFLIGSRR